ncbi:MAG: hypothetical protein AB8B94_05725 [Hyphomicrobiales bacterium]
MNTANRQFPFLLFLFLSVLAFIAFTLGGCGHIPITSMYKLSKVDVNTTDIEKLRVAVQIPTAVEVRDEGVTMIMSLAKTDKLPKLYERFELENLRQKIRNPVLVKHQKAGKKILIYRLAKTDIRRFNRFRKIQSGGGNGENREGQLSISTALCRSTDIERSDIRLSTFLKTLETKEFVPLVLNVKLAEAYPKKEFNKQFPMCK